jgi:hypothetical protein
MSQIFGPVWFPPIEHVRGLLLAWTPREGGQGHAEFATFGELHTSSGHPTAIGSRRAQSSTRIPASTLLLEPEHGKTPAPARLLGNDIVGLKKDAARVHDADVVMVGEAAGPIGDCQGASFVGRNWGDPGDLSSSTANVL